MISAPRSTAWLACAVVLLVSSGAGLVHALAEWQGVGPPSRPWYAVRAADGAVVGLLAAMGVAVVASFGKRRREAEAANKRCWAVLEATVDNFLAVDEDEQIVAVSSRVAHFFGYEPAELLGQCLSAILSDTSKRPPAGEAGGDGPGKPTLGEGDVAYEMAGRRKDGKHITIERRIGPSLPMDGDRLVTAMLLRDVT